MKKTILILLMAVSFGSVNAQKVTYTIKDNQAEYFYDGKPVMKVVDGKITESADLNRTAVQQCVDQKWKNCLHNNWCDCIWEDINYSACNFAFYAECIKESKDGESIGVAVN